MTVIGNVGSLPTQAGDNGTRCGRIPIRFGLAQNQSFGRRVHNELTVRNPVWFSILARGMLGERSVRLLRKNALVLVYGDLRPRVRVGPTGSKTVSYEIEAHEILKIAKLSSESETGVSARNAPNAMAAARSMAMDGRIGRAAKNLNNCQIEPTERK